MLSESGTGEMSIPPGSQGLRWSHGQYRLLVFEAQSSDFLYSQPQTPLHGAHGEVSQAIIKLQCSAPASSLR